MQMLQLSIEFSEIDDCIKCKTLQHEQMLQFIYFLKNDQTRR